MFSDRTECQLKTKISIYRKPTEGLLNAKPFRRLSVCPNAGCKRPFDHWIRNILECIFIGIGLNYCPASLSPAITRDDCADQLKKWTIDCDALHLPVPLTIVPAHSSSFLLAFTFLSFSLPCLLCPLFSLIHSRTLPVSSCLTGSDRLYPLSVVLKSIRPGLDW